MSEWVNEGMWEKSASYPNECCWVTSTSHSLILILLIKPTLLLSIFFTQSFIVAALSLFLNHLTHTSIFFLHLFLSPGVSVLHTDFL